MYNPLYANAGQQPTMFMQPNQTFLLQQQGINPQQQPQFITMGMAAAPPPQQQNVQVLLSNPNGFVNYIIFKRFLAITQSHWHSN